MGTPSSGRPSPPQGDHTGSPPGCLPFAAGCSPPGTMIFDKGHLDGRREMERQLPLQGIRVVDITIWIQGPLAASILADLGAEVIKIEKPGMGDFARGSQRLQNQDALLPDGRALAFEVPNRNKKGIAVDLYRPEGRDVLYRLVRESDVVVTNLHPPALRQMGADKETILGQNPEIIYAQASGYGQRGPHGEDPCQDTVGMARSGFMYLNATPQGEPVYPMGLLSDVLSGTMLASGVLAALLAKERTGRTPTVYSSQLSSMMWLALYPVAVQANLGAEYPSFDRTDAANPLMSIYRCADGRWLALGLFIGERFWHDFCDEVGEQELEFDARFATDDLRLEHRKELVAIIDRILGARPSAE